jgi:hypothetical protein
MITCLLGLMALFLGRICLNFARQQRSMIEAAGVPKADAELELSPLRSGGEAAGRPRRPRRD